jgi:hypothetical protein
MKRLRNFAFIAFAVVLLWTGQAKAAVPFYSWLTFCYDYQCEDYAYGSQPYYAYCSLFSQLPCQEAGGQWFCSDAFDACYDTCGQGNPGVADFHCDDAFSPCYAHCSCIVPG